jgi:hypothetical protein
MASFHLRQVTQATIRARDALLPPERVRKPYVETVMPATLVGSIFMLVIGQWTAAAILGVVTTVGATVLMRARRG